MCWKFGSPDATLFITENGELAESFGSGESIIRGNRHTLVTELSESGAGDEVIMSIAGHVARAMLSRYSHVRMEAKRRALDEIAARQRAADEKHREEAPCPQEVAPASRMIPVQ